MDYDAYVKEPLPFINELLKYFKKKDKLTIFEIGSCEGEDTIRLKKAFPNSTVYTFEALPKNIKIIEKNLNRYKLPADRVYELALSDSNGTAEFHVSSGHPDELPKTKGWDYGNKSSSLLPPKKHKKILKWVKFNELIKVKTQRLDDFCKENKVMKIDFIYLDVQGAELMVLEGAGEFLKKIGAIWMEVEAVELYKGQPLKTDVEKFMQDNEFRRIKDTVDNISGDQLYVRSELPSRKSLNIIRNLFKKTGSL